MSGHVEHVSSSLDGRSHHFRRPSSQSSNQRFYDAPDGSSDGPLIGSASPPSLLPATKYSQSPPGPALSQPLLSLPTDSPSNPPENHEQSGRASPDPHEFYRQHQPPFVDVQNAGMRSGDIASVAVDSVTADNQLRESALPSVSADTTLQSSRLRQYRSTSESWNRGLGHNGGKVPPAASSTVQPRQASFKDLVNKFNNNVDEVLPLPSRSGSQTTSRAGSPGPSVDAPRRSSASSRPRVAREFSAPGGHFIARWNSAGSSQQDHPEQSSPTFGTKSTFGGKSFANPHLSQEAARRPLFGELLSVNTAVQSPGYGIPSHMRRRGSEGSIPSPNPAFLDPQSDQAAGLSPLTPTAWYLGQIPFLEAVNTGANRIGHRRSRSDLSGNTSNPLVNPLNPHMAVSSSPLHSNPEALLETPHSKSRIPVSSRRLHYVSDSDTASPPRRTNSTFAVRSSSQVPLAPKGTSRLPKPSHSPVTPPVADDAPSTLEIRSPGRRETAHGRGRHQLADRSPLLQAYVAAPPPKKSPPLRSSRPRQPVSSATTVASRSKVVERVSSFQRQLNYERSSRPRERKIPELGNVDFADRRQKIQQAFSRSVQENARKEEEAAEIRRRARAKARQQSHDPQRPPAEQPRRDDTVMETPPETKDITITIEKPVDNPDELVKISLPPETMSQSVAQLTINTDVGVQESSPRDEAHLVTQDSPTLGLPVTISTKQEVSHENPQSSNVPPASALTSEPHEAPITTFDPEPQTEVAIPQTPPHRTLLSQIMQMRESSPSSSSSCEEQDFDFSDNDDKESIPIMLRETAYFEDSLDSSDNQDQRDFYVQQDQNGNVMPNRWSMSSWSSSLRNQHSADEPCDGSAEDLAEHPSSIHESETTLPSCSASSAPASDSEHPFIPSFPPNDPASQPHAENQLPQHDVQLFSNPPSLARQGGWDSKRVTQLYFKELARGRIQNLSMPAVRSSPEPGLLNADKRADGRTDSLTDDPVMVPRFEDIPASDKVDHTASLVFRDDWEHASPSIADWMQIAAEDGPGLSDENNSTTSMREGAPTPRLITSRPQISVPESDEKGLGLAIHVQSPQEFDDAEEYRPPPLPHHSPPPPPKLDGHCDVSHAPPQMSPSIYSSQPPSSIPPNGAFAPLGPVQSTGSSDDSSPQRAGPTPSLQTLESSATSLLPPSSDKVHAEIKKGSPSPEQRRLKKRRNVIKELVDTEYTFGRDMKVVDDIYKGTSSSCLDLSAEDVKTLFGNSDQIVQFSMSFQDSLKKATQNVYVMPRSQRWSSKRSARSNYSSTPKDEHAESGPSDLEKDQMTFVGQAFIAHMGQMEKVYAEYLKNHDAANKKLQILQQSPTVNIWLKECCQWASDLTTAWDLDSLLVKPVQRILKYPLLLSELLDSTPENHPDRAAIAKALDEVTNISVRINEMKKRADLVGQVVGRKRKESDVRAGLSKAFGRRTEKLKQQVGLSGMFEDKEYDALSQRFGDSFFQLQVVMRDVEMYTREARESMDRFNEFVTAIEGFIDVSQSSYAELESKWRRFRMSVRDINNVALREHLDAVRKSVIDPMVTLLKLHEGPQRVMRKRDKRLMDYARFKAVRDRGDKPDKKTTEQGEQFVALNETLKDELPKLYSLTAKLMEACLNNFVQIQSTWYDLQQKKLDHLIDAFPDEVDKIIADWSGDFTFFEAQILGLGICNGSILADTINLVNFSTPTTGANISSPRRPSTVHSGSTRVGSSTLDESPKVPHEFSNGSNIFQSPLADGQSQMSGGRNRADSSLSGPGGPETPEMPRSQMLQHITSAPNGAVPYVPNSEPFPSLPRLSLDTPFLADVINATSSDNPPTSPAGRYSGFFSSAMPMSDSPCDNAAPIQEPPKEPKVLFLAASIYEFNIDRARREAGYPYLTYVAGEIFDVIGEKGELWLAKNQDDPTHQVGWIWNKHFAKLAT